MKEIFVGNIAFDVSEADLKDLFKNYGVIEQCKLITDRVTGKSKGFAFVKYAEESSADEAIKETNNFMFKGRPLNVKISEPRERTSGGFGGGSRDGDSRGGRGGDSRGGRGGDSRGGRDGGRY